MFFAGAVALATSAAAAPQLVDTGSTLAERVNTHIDNLKAVGDRLLEIPFTLLLPGVAVAGVLAAWVIARLSRARFRRVLVVTEACLVTFAALLVIERKLMRLEGSVREIRTRMAEEAAGRLDTGRAQVVLRQEFLFDVAAANHELGEIFGHVSIRPHVYDAATDLVQLRVFNPMVHAFLAVIDLRHPQVEIKLDATPEKTLTSAFARGNDCTVAINGEAGLSPAPGSGLGEWKGDLVISGKVVMQESPQVPRPYLWFDRANKASYVSSAAADRALTPEKYNVIWGRWDALANGLVQTTDLRLRQPRTAMGINRDGTRLYLLIVDGRQDLYSDGLTRAEVGRCLKAFGAYQGMLCDEGGSTCLFLKQLGGITNIPSDNEGEERPTYTHFGIALHPDR